MVSQCRIVSHRHIRELHIPRPLWIMLYAILEMYILLLPPKLKHVTNVHCLYLLPHPKLQL